MLVRGLQVAGPQQPQVQRGVIVRPGVEVGRDPIALALIFIAAKLQIAQHLVRHAVALLIGVALLDIVDAALILVIDGGDDGAEGVAPANRPPMPSPPSKLRPALTSRVIHRCAAQRLVAATQIGIKERRAAMLGPAARHEVDRAAESLGIHVRSQCLAELDAADDAGGERIEGDSATAAKGRGRIGGRQAHACVGRAIEIRIQPANIDEAPLAAESVSSEMPGMRCSASAMLMSGSLMISLRGCTSMMLGACCFSSIAAARSVVALGATCCTVSAGPGPVLTRPMSVSLWPGVPPGCEPCGGGLAVSAVVLAWLCAVCMPASAIRASTPAARRCVIPDLQLHSDPVRLEASRTLLRQRYSGGALPQRTPLQSGIKIRPCGLFMPT